MKLTDFYYRRLGRMLEDPNYEIGVRYIPKLLDSGFIKEIKWTATGEGFHLDCSCYGLTEKGIKAYKEWNNETFSNN
jgi:hypothetical protein